MNTLNKQKKVQSKYYTEYHSESDNDSLINEDEMAEYQFEELKHKFNLKKHIKFKRQNFIMRR